VRQIFQDPYLSLNPAKDVGWHIETAARLNRIDPEDVWAVFESTRLAKGKFESRLTSTLSGGERQMLAFSMALAQQPDCLVLDEPFSYLDTLNRFRMLSLLRKTKDRILHIYVDNDIDRCAYVSDFIYILKSGQVIEQGTPERIIDSPREEFTREVVRNRLDMKSRKLVTGNDSPFRSALSA
jgi:peptide/nickel transport system ATP-binding protein